MNKYCFKTSIIYLFNSPFHHFSLILFHQSSFNFFFFDFFYQHLNLYWHYLIFCFDSSFWFFWPVSLICQFSLDNTPSLHWTHVIEWPCCMAVLSGEQLETRSCMTRKRSRKGDQDKGTRKGKQYLHLT